MITHVRRLRNALQVLAVLCVAAASNQKAPGEHEVIAAFLLNFTKFVEWPAESHPEPASPFVVGVIGKDPFGEILDRTLAGQKVAGRPFAVRRFDGPEGTSACHILFVVPCEPERLEAILAGLRSKPVLTVSNMPEFASIGGTIGFTTEGGRMRFELNPAELERSRLKASSKLLKLARIVGGKQP